MVARLISQHIPRKRESPNTAEMFPPCEMYFLSKLVIIF